MHPDIKRGLLTETLDIIEVAREVQRRNPDIPLDLILTACSAAMISAAVEQISNSVDDLPKGFSVEEQSNLLEKEMKQIGRHPDPDCPHCKGTGKVRASAGFFNIERQCECARIYT